MLTDILRRYQRYNPDTGAFDQERSLRNYAQVIDVNVSTLSLLFSGIQAEPSRATLQSLVRAFPAAADEIAAALRNQTDAIPA
jgi:DNA-binding helix-hairpin-helix protein with protein kinase domain